MSLRQFGTHLHVATDGKALVEITDRVREWTEALGLQNGLLTVFCRHTSASLLIQENAAAAVRADLERFFDRLAPERPPTPYEHDDEGPDDMPAHLKTALTQVQLTIPIEKGRLALGTWQGIYLFEHRRAAHRRDIVLHVLGE